MTEYQFSFTHLIQSHCCFTLVHFMSPYKNNPPAHTLSYPTSHNSTKHTTPHTTYSPLYHISPLLIPSYLPHPHFPHTTTHYRVTPTSVPFGMLKSPNFVSTSATCGTPIGRWVIYRNSSKVIDSMYGRSTLSLIRGDLDPMTSWMCFWAVLCADWLSASRRNRAYTAREVVVMPGSQMEVGLRGVQRG